MSMEQKKSPASGLAYWSNTPSIQVPEQLVFCIPGLGAPGSDFHPLLELLIKAKPQSLYVAPDIPGGWASPSSLCPDGDFPTIIKLLAQLRDELVTPAKGTVLIGHSMGCRLALEAFTHWYENVTAIVLLDGSWHGTTAPKRPSTEPLPPRDAVVQYSLGVQQSLYSANTPQEHKDKHTKHIQEDADFEYLGLQIYSNRKWDAERMIPALQHVRSVHEGSPPVSLLLVQAMDGAGGPRRPLKKGEETDWMKLAKEHAGEAYTAVVIEDAGHWVQVDKPDEVAQAILPLINPVTKA